MIVSSAGFCYLSKQKLEYRAGYWSPRQTCPVGRIDTAKGPQGDIVQIYGVICAHIPHYYRLVSPCLWYQPYPTTVTRQESIGTLVPGLYGRILALYYHFRPAQFRQFLIDLCFLNWRVFERELAARTGNMCQPITLAVQLVVSGDRRARPCVKKIQ